MSSGTIPAAAVTAAGLLAVRAAEEPDRVALVVEGGGDLTYRAWDDRSNALARGLAARGVAAGDRVTLLFDPGSWADFATAYLGVVKVGASAVLLSPGAAAPERSRALSHSAATGLLCAPDLALPGLPVWAAQPGEVARGQSIAPVAPGPQPVELVYPPAPLSRPRPWAPSAADVGPSFDGWLVHAWAPGSLAGQYAMRVALAGTGSGAATTAAFDPERLCALIAGRGAAACGLTPALAAALLASGAPRRHDLSSVSRVLLSEPPSPALRARLDAAFPGAAVAEIPMPARAPVAGGRAPAPVAVSQEGMLWHEQFTPGSFNLPCLVRRYEGRLDVAALEWALSELVRRHQPLRSTFELVDGVPHQAVADHHGFRLAVVDLGHLPGERGDAEAARLLADASRRPFDLATGPLFEPRLLRLGPDDHLLVVRLHHTVFDDWSVDVFRRELSALYAARREGAPAPLVEPPTSFGDFCRRQRARLDGEPGVAQRSWWQRELDGAPLAVQLPIGGHGAHRDPGEPLRVDLPPPLAAALRALAPQLRATPFMTVLAAFSALVARVIGQDDLVLATVVAHRDQSDLEPLVGCFTKKVPLRLRLHGDPTFPELVARTRASLLGALSHQDVAFDAALQEGLGRPAADHGVVPQVTVVFQGETPKRVKLSLPGLTTGPFKATEGSRAERHFSSRPREADDWGDRIYLGTFLILSLVEEADGMALVARGVFDGAEARGLLDDFVSLLAEVVAEPASQLGGGPRTARPADVVELRGFRARRSRLEAAMGRCPGVAEVAVAVRDDGDGAPRLVAYVVADGDRPPTLAQLRQALWTELPGTLWPAEMVVVEALVRRPDGRLDVAALAAPGRDRPRVDPTAALLAAMWGEVRGRPAGPRESYWQDFSFLEVLAEARQAGLPIGDEHVVRSRTPEMLAAALHADRAPQP